MYWIEAIIPETLNMLAGVYFVIITVLGSYMIIKIKKDHLKSCNFK